MKFCPECGKPRKEEKAFCGGCGNAFAKNQVVSSGTSAPSKNNFVLLLLAIVAVAVVGAGAWFFVAGGPPTMEEYRNETTQLWEEYFDNAINVAERIAHRAETAGWVGRNAETIFKSDVEYVLVAFDEYLSEQIRILQAIEAAEIPEEMSAEDEEILNELIAFFLVYADVLQAASRHAKNEILPRFGSEINTQEFFNEVFDYDSGSHPFYEMGRLMDTGELVEPRIDEVERIAQQFNWARTSNSAINHHLAQEYSLIWTDADFVSVIASTLIPGGMW